MISPALLEAGNDPEIRGNALVVFLHLHNVLDPAEYRPLKAGGLAQTLHMKPHRVGMALRVLCERGYLRAEERRDGRVRFYRLCTVRAK